MDFERIAPSECRNINFSLEKIEKQLYICRPHRGVEQYPSTELRAGYLHKLSHFIENHVS